MIKKRMLYALVAAAVFGGALAISEVEVVRDAHAECTSTWAGCSETETSTLQEELNEAGN